MAPGRRQRAGCGGCRLLQLVIHGAGRARLVPVEIEHEGLLLVGLLLLVAAQAASVAQSESTFGRVRRGRRQSKLPTAT